MALASLPILLFIAVLSLFPLYSYSAHQKLNSGSSLSVEDPNHVLVSPRGNLSAGFYRVGDNAYSFAIWFSKPLCLHDCSLMAIATASTCLENCTVVWMANRDQPVNGKRSQLTLLGTGNLVLRDAGMSVVWSSNTSAFSTVVLKLKDSGNLVLMNEHAGGVNDPLWQSFDFPTDTLLPLQLLTRKMHLVSARSKGDFSPGLYSLYFDEYNVLRLRYISQGNEISSTYWPPPYLFVSQSGRSTYNNTKVALLDSSGRFTSSDNFHFRASDYGASLQRRLKLDSDGNLRLYSRQEDSVGGGWMVSWEATSHPCAIHGVCGESSVCTYVAKGGASCTCLPGYKKWNKSDWSFGCKPDFKSPKQTSKLGFLRLPHVDFYGYDLGTFSNYKLEECQELCLKYNCSGFQYTFDYYSGGYYCYPKYLLLNGHRSSFEGTFYLKLPKVTISNYHNRSEEDVGLSCSDVGVSVLKREYEAKRGDSGALNLTMWFAIALGAFQFVFFLVAYWLLRERRQHSNLTAHGYLVTQTGFRRFTYSELKKATNNFSEEIGRGGAASVYKGRLPDLRVGAIKRLDGASQGEAEFLAEVNTIGQLNHMNLIDMWGYCAEKNHRLLVYEYLEHGSLAETLSSHGLDWQKRYQIALGTARGLAYLHEECLEWVLHCDVKPQNILLDSDYHPKVSDFGLSTLLDRNEKNNLGFSRIRGTRGYMAPEWISNLPITSKVDVYSYGIVTLELLTGKPPLTGVEPIASGGKVEYKRLISWVRSTYASNAADSLLEEIVDPCLKGDYNIAEAQTLLRVGLQCVEDDKDARPTMSQVVEMLLHHTRMINLTYN